MRRRRGGRRANGWPGAGRIEAGALADFATVGLDSPRLAGTRPEHVVAALVFVACASDVTDLVVGGRQVVAEGSHLLVDEPGRAMAEALARIDRVMGLS